MATIRETSDVASNVLTAANIVPGDRFVGTIDPAGDRDWIAIELTRNNTYEFYLDGRGGNALADPFVTLYNDTGEIVAFDDDSNGTLNSALMITPKTSGRFFLEAASFDQDLGGDYSLDTFFDIPQDITSAVRSSIGEDLSGSIDFVGDRDWIAVTLSVDARYTFDLFGPNNYDTGLTIYDADGNRIRFDEDGGNGLGARIADFSPDTTGTYFLEARGDTRGSEQSAGSFTLRLREIGAEGTSRNDFLGGTPGRDVISALAGNDVVTGSAGADVLDGGPGFDVLRYTDATSRIIVDLARPEINFGDARGDLITGFETIFGGRGADQLRGDTASNAFFGEDLSDRLYGRGGNDLLIGGRGVDALYGNRGADVMFGDDDQGRFADQRDRFIYFQYEDSGVGEGYSDILADYDPGLDRIEISRFDGDLTSPGKQELDFVGQRAFSGTAGEVRFERGSQTIVQIDNDGDAEADFEIIIDGNVRLTDADFLL